MNKDATNAKWDHFRMINGITMRAIQALPKDKIDSRPCKDMRTPKELINHMYNSMREIAEGAAKGDIKLTEELDNAAVAKLKTYDDVVRFAMESWNASDKAIRSMTDAQLVAMVSTPWGQSFPGFDCVNILYDEHLHHRGQLYAYLRQLGVAPPFMWDFEHSAPEFQPKQPQQV